MDGEISFEEAAARDVEIFRALERNAADPKTWGPLSTNESALREIGENTLYFIKRGNAVLGMAAYRVRPDGSVYISNVAIDPAFRRQGLARSAMEHILRMNASAPRIDLVTHPENHNALRLYVSLGFAVESRKEDYFGDGEPRLVLARGEG